MPSVNTIMLIFALAALGILALSALVGFLAGFKRELRLMIVFVVLLGSVWLVFGNPGVILNTELPAFASTMLHDTLSGMFTGLDPARFTTLSGVIAEVAGAAVPNIKELLVEGTKTYALLMSVVEFVLRFVFVLVGTIVVYVLCILIRVISFVIRLIYRLCTIRYRRRKRAEREAKRETGLDEGVVVVKSDIYDGEVVVTLSRNPKKVRKGKRRGWAAGLGLLRGAFTVLLICVPITGLLSIVNEVEPETVDMVLDVMNGGQSEGQVAEGDNELLDFVFEFAEAYDSGIVAEIIGSSEYFLGKELDETLFDNLLKIETSTQTIYVREEVIKIIQIANLLPEAYDPDKAIPIDIWSLSDVKQDRIIELLKEFKLFAEIMPIAIEFAGTLDVVKDFLGDSGQTLDSLSDIDWSSDLNYILDAVRHAIELGDITEEFDIMKLNCDVLRDVVSNIGKTEFIAKLMPIVINAALHLEMTQSFIGEWPKENVIVTDGISWDVEFVNLVGIFEQFQTLDLDLANLDVMAIISDNEKLDIIKGMVQDLVTSDLFIEIALQVLDFAKEFQLGNLGFEEFQNILKLTNLVAPDWEEDVATIIEMVKIVNELGILAEEGFDINDPDCDENLQDMIHLIFDLNLISNKAGVNYSDPSKQRTAAIFNEVKTLLVEAALRQFKLFDIEGEDGFIFEQFTDDERASIQWEAIDWENEAEVYSEERMLCDAVGYVVELLRFYDSKGITLENIGNDVMALLEYDETFTYLIDILDSVLDSSLLTTIIPYALEKFLVPIIEDFEDKAELPDGEDIDITDQISRHNISAEIFNFIYILMDAKEIGLIGAVTSGELNLNLAANIYIPTTDSSLATFNEKNKLIDYVPVLEYYPAGTVIEIDGQQVVCGENTHVRPDLTDLALTDIVKRVFHSKLFAGKEAKIFRVLFAVLLDTKVSKDAINAIDFSSPNRESELNKLVNSINGLRPILEDFNEIYNGGDINLEYFYEKENALQLVDSLRVLFTSDLIAVLLPELYHQYLLPQGILPEEFADILTVQSLYWAEHKNNPDYLEGLTGKQLTEDLVTILSIAELLIDFDLLNILSEDKDVLFANATDTFNRLFDLIMQLNILEGNGNELVALLVNMLLDVEIPVEDFEALGVNWKDEVALAKEVVAAIFELLENSGIEGFKKLQEVMEDPMAHLENFLVDANVKALADIITQVSQSKVLEVLALPLVNKFIPGMLEGVEEFTEEEYSGALVAEDIKALADILYNVADAQLMETIKALLGEFTELLPKSEEEVAIPLSHEQYANIIELVFGLNILQTPTMKNFIVDMLKDTLSDMDLSSVTPEGLDFAQDGKTIADAYRVFAEAFVQTTYEQFTVQNVLDLINGETEISSLEGLITQNNLYAVVDLLEGVLSTTLAKEFSLVVFNFAKEAIPAEFGFIFDVEIFEDEFHQDIISLMNVLRAAIALNPQNILFDKGIELKGVGESLKTIIETLVNTNLIHKNATNVVIGVLGVLGLEVTAEDLAGVDYEKDLEGIYEIFNHLEDILLTSKLEDHLAILDLIENLDIEAILANEDIVCYDNLESIVGILEELVGLTIVPAIFEPAYNTFVPQITENLDPALQPFFSIDDYSADMFAEDLQSLVYIVRQVVEFGALAIYRGSDIDWSQTEPIENIIETLFALNYLNAKLDEIVTYVSDSMFDLSELDVEAVRAGLASDGQIFANIYKIIAEDILAQEWFPIHNLDDLDSFGIDTLPFENLVSYETLVTVGKVVQNFVSTNLVYEALPIVFDYAKGLVPENLAFLVDVELDSAELQEELFALIDIAEVVVDIIRPALPELAANISGILDGSVDPLSLELQFNLENLYADVKEIVKIIDGMNLIDGRGKELLIGALSLAGITVTEEDLADLTFANDKDLAELIAYKVVDLLTANELNSVKAFLDLTENLSLENEDLINGENVIIILDIVELILQSEVLRALFVPVYDQMLKETVEGTLPEGLKELVEFNDSFTVDMLFDDIISLVYIAKQAVEFGAIGIYRGADIDWAYTQPIENIIETLFTLNILNAKLDEIVTYVSDSMFDLSELDVEAVRAGLVNDGVILGDVYAILANGIFTQEAFPVHSISDIESLELDVNSLLTEEILTSAIDAVERLLDLGLIYELLPVLYGQAQMIIPDDLYYIVSNSLTKDELISDVRVIIPVLREVVAAKLYNAALEDQAIPFKGIAGHLTAIIDALVNTNIISKDADAFVSGTLRLFGIEAGKDVLEAVDYAHDLNSLYQIFETIEDILLRSEFEDHIALLDFVNTLDLTTILDNEVLVNNNNINSVIDILENVVNLTLIPALYEPAYNALVDLEAVDEKLQGFLDLSEYSSDMLVEDLNAIIAVLRNVVDFDALSIVRGAAINWGNIEAVENIINSLFGLNYLNVKVDEIVDFVTENVFDLSDLYVEGIDLAADGARLAQAYRLLAENILAQNWFPIQFISDLETLNLETLPLDKLLTEETLTVVVDAFELILTTSLVYEVVPVLYDHAQMIIPDDLYFLVSQSLTKDQLQEDVLSILSIFREVISTEIYNAFLNEGVPLEGIADHVANVFRTILDLNLVDGRLNEIFDNVFKLFDIDVDTTIVMDADFEGDLEKIYKILNLVEDILLNSEFETHLDVLEFVDGFQTEGLNNLTQNESVLSNENLVCLLDILDTLVSLDTLQVLFEPVYNKFIVLEDMPEELHGLLDISEYPANFLVEDLHSIISVLRNVVEFDVLGVLRGAAINWQNIEAVENIINEIFGLNLLNVKLDDIVDYVTETIFDLSELDVEAIDLVADGARLAQAYRMIAENILTQSWFPVQFLSDFGGSTLYVRDVLNAQVLNVVVDVLEQILTTSIVYEVVPVMYSFAQTIIPDDLYFIVSNSLTKDELQEDVLSILAILREVIDMEVYNIILKDEVLEFEGLAEHISNIFDIIFNINILDKDPINLFIGAFKLVGIELTRADLESVDTSADAQVLYGILEHIEDILIQSQISNHEELLTLLSEFDINSLLEERFLNGDNVESILAILEEVLSLSLLPAILEPAYNAFVPEMIAEMPEDLQALLSLDDYSTELFLEDAKALVYILRQAVEFGAIGIYRGADINWSYTEPIENVFKTIFALNFLNVKLDEIVTYVTNHMFDLSELDVEALRGKLANDGVILADVYRILATEILSLDIFPIKSINDLSEFTINPGDFLTEEILTSAIDVLERLLDLGLIYEALPVAYALAQTIIPDDLYYIVSNSLTKDELISDVRVVITILREAVAAKLYNAMLAEQAVPFEGIANHLATIIDAITHTNIISKDADTFVSSTLKLFGIEVSKDVLEAADYNHDLGNLYNILNIIENILLRSDLEDHIALLEFVNTLDLTTILDNEVLVNNNNINYVLDILENLVDLSLVPVLFEPVFNALVDVESFDENIRPFLDLSEYPAEMLVEDLFTIIDVLRNAVQFDALSIVRGNAINWENIEAIENVITDIFGLNYLAVKLDDIINLITDNVFDLSELDVAGINLAADGEKVAKAYRMLAEAILTQNWFPIQFLSDLETLNFDVTMILNAETLHVVVDALNEILTTSLVYEVVPVMYNYAQLIIPDSLYFLVSESLTKDELAADVQAIVSILREVVDSEAYNIVLNKGIEIEGIADHFATILETIFHTNILGKDLPKVFNSVFGLFGIEIEKEILSDVDFDGDLNRIRKALNSIEDALLNAKFLTHLDILEFMNGFSTNGIAHLTENTDVLNNTNLIHLLDALEQLVGLDTLLAIFEPVYNFIFVLDNINETMRPFFDLSEYPASMLVEDLQSIIGALRSAVEFDVLGVLRGNAINWNNIEAVENVINAIFGLNYLDVKLDEIINFVTNNVFDLSELDVAGVDLEADGAKVALAYRMIAENILTQNWFPIQFLSNIGNSTLFVRDVLNAPVLNVVVDAIQEILTTSLVYEVAPVMYSYAQTIVPDDLYFIIANALTKDELQDDILSVLDVLRELIAMEVYNVILEGEVIEFNGVSEHVNTILDTLFNTNILGKDPINLYIGLFNLLGVELNRELLESVDTSADAQVLFSILEHVEEILINSQISNHRELLTLISEFSLEDVLADERLINGVNAESLLAILEDVLGLSLLPAIFEPVYNAFVPEMIAGLNPDLQALLSIEDYPAELFIEDAKTLVYVLRQLVDFGAIGIYRGADINWSDTKPIENILEAIFALNFLNVKLDEIVTFVSNNMYDLSALDVESLRGKLANDGAILADVYRILATEIFTLDIFPIKSINDLSSFTINPGDYLTEEILTSAIDALERLLDLGLIYEALPVAYEFVQLNIPADLYYIVAYGLTKDELISDVRVIIPVLREAVAAKLYNAMLADQTVPFEGIAEHLSAIIDAIAHTNIISKQPNAFVSGTLELLGIEVSEDALEVADYNHDLGNLYNILDIIENILIRSNLEDHIKLLEFVNTLDVTTIIDNEELVNNNNLYYVVDILENLADLSLVPVLFEPVYNKFVDVDAMAENIKPFLDITEYSSEMFAADLKVIVAALRDVVAFDALGIYRGQAINWENIEAVENVIVSVFGLNYLAVKLDDVINYVTNNVFDISDLDVAGINLAADGEKVANAYRMLAEAILTQNWFPIQFLSDLESFNFDVTMILNAETLHEVVNALEEITTTSLVYEIVPVLYAKAPNALPDGLDFLVAEVLTKDELAADVQSILTILREAIDAEVFNIFLGKVIEIEGIADHIAVVLDTLFHTNILGKDLPRVFSGIFKVFRIEISEETLSPVNYDSDLERIYNALNSIEDALLNAKFLTHLDILEFMNGFSTNGIAHLTENTDVLNNTNLIHLLDALEQLVGMDFLLAVFEPVYNFIFVLDNINETMRPFFDLSEYPASMFVEDLQSIISGLRSAVEFDVLGVLRGSAINWNNIEAVEHVINVVFGLNYLDVKLDDIVRFISVNIFDITEMDVEAIDLVADGEKVAKAYRIIAENILTQNWFPIQFLSNIGNSTLFIRDLMNSETLYSVVDALDEIVTTSIVYELVPVMYTYAQEIMPESYYFLVMEELTKDQLASDVQSILAVLREAIDAELYKDLIGEGIAIEGLATHVSTMIDTLLHTNILGSDYARLFKNIFRLAGMDVLYEDLAVVDYEHDFVQIYAVLENIEDILLNGLYLTHLDVLGFVRNMPDILDIINNNIELVNNENLHEVLDSVDLLIDLSIIPAVYEVIYDKFVVLEDYSETIRPFLDNSNFGVELFVEDVHALVYALGQLVDFGALYIYRGGTINWALTEPIENVITTLFGLNYVNVKLENVLDLDIFNKVNKSLIDVELIRNNLEADAVVFAEVYRAVAQDILTRADFPCQTLNDIKELTRQDIKDFYSKEVAISFIEDVRPLIGTELVGEFLEVLYDFVQTKTPEDLYYVVEQMLTKEELRSDANDLLDAMIVLIESDLIKLAFKRDIPLAGISAPVNELIDIAAHTHLFGNDLARIVAGTFALLGMDVPYTELSTVDYEHDLLITYSIIEDIEAILLNSKATTVKGAYHMLRDALASGRKVLRNKDLVNEANALSVLDILASALDLDIARVLAEPTYAKVMNKVIDVLGLPAALADTNRYDYNDCIKDARIAIEIAREAIAFGAIEYYQDDTLIRWNDTTPVKNMIMLGFSTEFWNEFDYELIKFVGDKVGYDLVTGIDIESIDWIADSAVFAEAYEIVALGILSDPEFTVQRYSEIWTFDFNIRDYTKQRYALTGIDALDVCVDTTVFDAYALPVLTFINNRLPESLQFVIAETTISDPELRSDAHAGLYLAKLAINEGFGQLVTERDCDIIKPDFYKEAIEVLFDLNITKDSDVRVRLINVVLNYLGLETIDAISDWDNEEQAYLSLVDDVCEFLTKNDLTTAKKLYSFLVNKEFISGSFLTDENILEILDIMDVAVSSEVVTKVTASVYAKVVEKLPYEGVQNLVGFGTGARDYTKEGFYNDLPAMIDIARDIVNLGMLNVLRDGEWYIASSDEINALIDKGVALSLFNGRLDLFADYVFDVLSVNVDLNGIDWDNEIDVLQNVISIVLPALQDSGMIMLSDAKALAREILDAPVAFIKNNRAYANLTNAYVALDALEELGNSEVYMRSILPLYNRISHKLPAAITDYIDLSTYKEVELRADYPDFIAIARNGLDAQLYKALTERRGWSFPEEAVTALENIIALGCDLNFTARFTEGAIRMVANLLGIDSLPANLYEISLALDKEALVSIVASIREIWIGTNHIRPNIPMLANTDLFVEISFVMETLLDTTLSSVFVPWTYENYVVRIIEKLPTLDGRIDYSKLLSYKGAEVIELAEDGIIVFNELIAMNVFSMSGIDFTDNSHVITMTDILLKHVGFSARIENYLERLAVRSYLMGVIPVSYDQVTSTRGELSVIKGILVDTIELYRTYGSALLSRDFGKLLDGECEAMVLAIIDKLGDSVLLNTSFIPTLNGFGDVVIGSEDAVIYEACQVSTIPEFKEAVAGLFDILEKLDELGFLSKQIKYKDTEGIKELFMLIENSPFIKGQEGILAEFVLRHTDYIDHNDVDLKNINWANEYQYLYEFLDKANAPLNMDGIVITDYKALLDNPVFMNAFTDALRAFAPSELMVEMFMPLFDIASGKYATIGDLLDYSHLESLDDDDYADAIQAEYLSVLDLAVAISESGIMSDTDLINVNKLLAVYDIVFALEGTKNNKGDIFEKLSDKLPSFGDSELVIPEDVNWDTEIPAIRGIFASLNHFADVNGNINLNEISDIISESTDVEAFEALLTAINQSVIYRVQLFDTLNNEINNVSPDGDIVISKYLTDWFEDQEVNGMASIAEWDSEMVYLARILTIVNYMRQNGGFTSLGEMNLGKDVVEHAATVSTDEFNVANYGLKQLLQLMSVSKSFTLTALNSDLEAILIDNDEHDGLIKTEKQLAQLNDAEWDAEIDDLIRLVHNIQVLELLDSSTALVDQIKACTKAEIEELLVSFNHCAAVRDLLPDMMSETLDDSDAEDWKSEWLMAQVGVDALGNNKPMASEAEWDAEAKEIAAIINTLDTFDFDKEISTYNQDDIDHLRELLHEMNHDKSLDVSYIIEFLNKNVLDKGYINTTKRFETPTTWDMAKWDLELDRMVDVIAVAIENDLFGSDSGNALANMSKDQIEAILNTINNSEIMRTVLPDLVYNAVKSAGQDSWLSEDKWLENQTGQTAGVNNPVESVEAWADEIEKYAFIISKSSSYDFENLELDDNAKLAELKEILKAMNETKSFTLDPIVDIINDLLEDKGYNNVTVVGVIDGANKDSSTDINGSNKDEWTTELDVLFDIIEKMNNLGTIQTDTISSKSQDLGELLDQMKVSYLFGNDVRDDDLVNVDDNVFNALVIDVLTTTNMIDNGTNGGFIKESDALTDDWSRYNWTSELAIISEYDNGLANQSDEFIGKAQSSEIIKEYFDIAGELNARIDKSFTLLGHDYELKVLVETANGGPLTNEGLATRVWADELNDVKKLTNTLDSFGGSIDIDELAAFALALDGIRSNPTLAGSVADDILSSVGL